LGQSAYAEDVENMATYIHRQDQPGITPLISYPSPDNMSGVGQAALSSSSPVSSGGWQTPATVPGGSSFPAYSTPNPPTPVPSQPYAVTTAPPSVPPWAPPSSPKRRWRTLYTVLIALVILVLVG